MGKSKYMKQPSGFIDTGIPLVNQIIDIFFMIALVAVGRMVALEIYYYCRKRSLSKRIKPLLKSMCEEGAYWGTVAALYVGLEFATKFLVGIGDWKKAMVAGALTGALVSAAGSNRTDKVVADAIMGGAIATAAKVLDDFT